MRKLLSLLALLSLVGLSAYAQAIQGTVSTSYNVVAPTKPTAAIANAGAGLVTSGAHSYKITFTGVAGETLPSPASAAVTTDTATNGKVSVTIPNLPDQAVAVNVYRTVAGDTGDYKLVNATPIGTTGQYIDNVADGSLGASAPVANDTSPAVVDPTDACVAALADLGAGLRRGARPGAGVGVSCS